MRFGTKFRRRVCKSASQTRAVCRSRLMQPPFLKVSYDIIWRRGRFDSTLFDLLALAPPPRSSMSPARNLRHLRSTAGGCRGHRSSGRRPRPSLSLSLSLSGSPVYSRQHHSQPHYRRPLIRGVEFLPEPRGVRAADFPLGRERSRARDWCQKEALARRRDVWPTRAENFSLVLFGDLVCWAAPFRLFFFLFAVEFRQLKIDFEKFFQVLIL
jgi:hypothetical protein